MTLTTLLTTLTTKKQIRQHKQAVQRTGLLKMNAIEWLVSNIVLFRCVVDDQERFQTAIRCACELVKSDSVLQLATDAVTRLSLHNALPYTISLSRLMLKLPNLQVTMYKYIFKHQNSINVMFRLCIVVCHFVEKIESVFRNHNNDLNMKKLMNSCRKSIFLVTILDPRDLEPSFSDCAITSALHLWIFPTIWQILILRYGENDSIPYFIWLLVFCQTYD